MAYRHLVRNLVVAGAAILVLCTALGTSPAAAQAEYSIWDIQLGLVPENTICYIDSVVVTAVGKFGYFVQEPTPHPTWQWQYSGLWVYTNQLHTFHKGDFITIRGTYKEYYASTEIDIPAAGSQGLQYLIGQRAIPNPVLCLVSEINDTGSLAEAYEGVFVRVDRLDNTLFAGSEDNTLRKNWPLHTEPFGGDTLFVYHENAKAGDDFEYDTPDSGTVLTHVQGVLQYNYNQYKIAPRSCEEDLGGPCKPKLRGAYAMAPDQVRVQFGVEVSEATAENVNNYELASGYLILSAERDPANHRLVLLTTEELPEADPEQIIVSGVQSEDGITMDPNQTANFRSGITPIQTIQYVANPAVQDASPLLNEVVTIQGRVTAVEGNYCYLQDAEGGAWDGMYSRVARNGDQRIGDRLQITGYVTEYYGLTEVSYRAGCDNWRNLGPSPDPVVVSTVTTAQIPNRGLARTAEPWETSLVRLQNATIMDSIPGTPGPYYGEWLLRQDAYPDTAMMDLDELYATSYDPCPGNRIDVTGILKYSFSRYRIGPRSGRGNDIIELYAVPGCPTTGVEDGAAASLRLRQNAPNPFAGTTSIGFSLPHNAQVSLEVIDVSGRIVRVLENRAIEAGDHAYGWDGHNGDGHPAAAGTYFYRLRVDGQDKSRKMVLMK